MQAIKCLYDLARQDVRQVAKQLSQFCGGAAQIAEPVDHLERHAQVRFDQLLLPFVCIREPLPDPIGEIGKRDLCRKFSDRPKSVKRANRHRAARKIVEDFLKLFLRDASFASNFAFDFVRQCRDESF